MYSLILRTHEYVVWHDYGFADTIKGLKIVQDYLGKPKIVTKVLKIKRGRHKVHTQKRQESRGLCCWF